MTRPTSHRDELIVLSMIGGGLVLILVLIICGLFGWFPSRSPNALPNWAENVLVALASMAGLKLGDVLAALVTLSAGRQVEKMGDRLADSAPSETKKPTQGEDAREQIEEAVEEVVDATVEAGAEVTGRT
jgi:cobalamin biosynthesis protein CobD/CbiB